MLEWQKDYPKERDLEAQNVPTVTIGRIAFTPVGEMPLEDLYNEQLGLSYWGEILQDTQPERTQARLDEINAEIERRGA